MAWKSMGISLHHMCRSLFESNPHSFTMPPPADSGNRKRHAHRISTKLGLYCGPISYQILSVLSVGVCYLHCRLADSSGPVCRSTTAKWNYVMTSFTDISSIAAVKHNLIHVYLWWIASTQNITSDICIYLSINLQFMSRNSGHTYLLNIIYYA